MIDPVFWLGVSILLVAVSIAAVLVAAMPAFRELARAARSAEKLFDTLNRDLPPTLQSIRDTSSEIVGLTDDMSGGVQGAGRVVQQVDQSISGVKQKTQVTTRSVVSGVKAAWKAFKSPDSSHSENINLGDDSPKDISSDPPRLPASTRPSVKIEKTEIENTETKKTAEIDTKDGSELPVDAVVEAEIALSHYSDSVAKLSEDLENIRDRLTQEKSGDVINK